MQSVNVGCIRDIVLQVFLYIVWYYDQQMPNNLTHYHTPTATAQTDFMRTAAT
jgi:hypothetical protein